MKRLTMVFAMALLGVGGRAAAFCQPGDVATCFANGQQGTKVCGDNAQFGPCSTAFQPQSGTCQPKYKILTVLYAPPGKNGGGSGNSSVNYGTGSTLGTTSASSQGFQSSYSVSASHKFGLFDSSGSYSYTNNTVDSSSIDIRKGASNSITSPGPITDGIDHNQDQIWIVLRPTVDVNFTSATTLDWSLDSSTPMNVQFLYVAWLKNPALVPVGVQNQLNAAGITSADYPDLLAADPYANGEVPLDTGRYAQLNTTFPYEPPVSQGSTGPSMSYTLTHSVSTTDSVAVSHNSTVSVSTSFGLLAASLKVGGTWVWTDSNTHSEITGTNDSATVTVGGPSFGYTGPTDVAVYYDRIYRTFLFDFVIPGTQPALSGTVVDTASVPVAGQKVEISSGAVTYTAYTNAAGEFHVFGVPADAPLVLKAGNARVALPHAHLRPIVTVSQSE